MHTFFIPLNLFGFMGSLWRSSTSLWLCCASYPIAGQRFSTKLFALKLNLSEKILANFMHCFRLSIFHFSYFKHVCFRVWARVVWLVCFGYDLAAALSDWLTFYEEHFFHFIIFLSFRSATFIFKKFSTSRHFAHGPTHTYIYHIYLYMYRKTFDFLGTKAIKVFIVYRQNAVKWNVFF